MSIKVMSAVWECDGLDASERLVMLSLADHADDDGRCYPSIARLCRRTSMSDRGVQKVISRLVERGFIAVQPNAGQAGANVYFLNTTPEPSSPPNVVHPRTRFMPPPNPVRKTPEPGSPKPSRTIIEPSEEPPCVPPAVSQAEQEAPEPKARLPSDWALSDEGWAYARSQHIPEEVIHDEARGFHAYWSDRRDRESRKSERGWEQCWAGWCRRIAGRYKPRGNMAGTSTSGGYGQGGSIASIAARRRATGQV